MGNRGRRARGGASTRVSVGPEAVRKPPADRLRGPPLRRALAVRCASICPARARILASLIVAGVLAGCGGSTKTVIVQGPPQASSGTATTPSTVASTDGLDGDRHDELHTRCRSAEQVRRPRGVPEPDRQHRLHDRRRGRPLRHRAGAAGRCRRGRRAALRSSTSARAWRWAPRAPGASSARATPLAIPPAAKLPIRHRLACRLRSSASAARAE